MWPSGLQSGERIALQAVGGTLSFQSGPNSITSHSSLRFCVICEVDVIEYKQRDAVNLSVYTDFGIDIGPTFGTSRTQKSEVSKMADRHFITKIMQLAFLESI